MLADFSVWWRPTPWFIVIYLLSESSSGRRGKRALCVSCIMALILFMKTPPSWPNNLPIAPPPNTITLQIMFLYMNLGEGAQTFTLYSQGWGLVLKYWRERGHSYWDKLEDLEDHPGAGVPLENNKGEILEGLSPKPQFNVQRLHMKPIKGLKHQKAVAW